MIAKEIRKEKMLQRKRRVPSTRWDSPFLKEFQLLTRSIRLLRLGTKEQFDVAKLLVGNAHDTDLAEFRQNGFHPFAMHLSVLHAGAMTHVDRELKHGEAILDETLAELRVLLDVLLRLSW